MMGTVHPVWWTTVSALAPISVLTAAVVVLWIGARALKRQQKAVSDDGRRQAMRVGREHESDAMAEWWRRAQWAMEASASPNDRMYSYGTGILGVLAANTQAGREEKELFDAVWRGSFTKMQAEEIEKLIEAYLAAGQHAENEPRIGYPSEPQPESESLGAANQLPALGNSGVTTGDLHSHSGAHDPDHGLWVLRTMRREIRAARLKVILDEELERDTSPMVQHLAQMSLPPIVDSRSRGSEGRDGVI